MRRPRLYKCDNITHNSDKDGRWCLNAMVRGVMGSDPTSGMNMRVRDNDMRRAFQRLRSVYRIGLHQRPRPTDLHDDAWVLFVDALNRVARTSTGLYLEMSCFGGG